MAASLEREQLLKALDEVGRAAIEAEARLDVAVYRGSALMLASNFRFGTEDVDIAELGTPWPRWLQDVVHKIALRNGWSAEWLNDGRPRVVRAPHTNGGRRRLFGVHPWRIRWQ